MPWAELLPPFRRDSGQRIDQLGLRRSFGQTARGLKGHKIAAQGIALEIDPRRIVPALKGHNRDVRSLDTPYQNVNNAELFFFDRKRTGDEVGMRGVG